MQQDRPAGAGSSHAIAAACRRARESFTCLFAQAHARPSKIAVTPSTVRHHRARRGRAADAESAAGLLLSVGYNPTPVAAQAFKLFTLHNWTAYVAFGPSCCTPARCSSRRSAFRLYDVLCRSSRRCSRSRTISAPRLLPRRSSCHVAAAVRTALGGTVEADPLHDLRRGGVFFIHGVIADPE